MTLDNPRSLLLVPLALLAAAALVWLPGMQRDWRRSNLDVGSSEVPSIYVQMDPSLPSRCTVSDRQASTLRRSDDPRQGQNWTFVRSNGDRDSGNLAHWLLRSKQRGTFVLVPLFDAPNWAYPYFHAFAREHGSAASLPNVRWVRLYVNRVYHGLYLQVWLPAATDGRGGALVAELLMVSGARMACADARLAAPCRVYPELVALGKFPQESQPTGLERWLFTLTAVQERLAVLQPSEPYAATAVPMPVSLQEEYARIMGGPLETLLDERFATWSAPGASEATASFPPTLKDALWAGWDSYRRHFEDAAATHCEYHQCTDVLPELIAARLERPLQLPAVAGVAKQQ